MIVMPLSALLLASVSPVPTVQASGLLAQLGEAPHIAALPLDGVIASDPPAPSAPSAPEQATSPQNAPSPQADSSPQAGSSPQAASSPAASSTPEPVAASPSPPAADAAPASEALLLRDPWQKPNRAIFAFDTFFERKLLAPVAHGYRTVTPRALRDGINNAILNMDEPSNALNQVVQLKIGRALKTSVRFVINTTLGIGGLFDVASAGGLRRRPADFGQTLGRYGARPGPYVMLPFLGPSNVRDGFGRLVDTFTDPVGFFIGGILTSPGGSARFAMAGVNWRERNDSTMSAIYGASDPYAFTRAAYSQQRAAVVQDATGKAAALPDF